MPVPPEPTDAAIARLAAELSSGAVTPATAVRALALDAPPLVALGAFARLVIEVNRTAGPGLVAELLAAAVRER